MQVVWYCGFELLKIYLFENLEIYVVEWFDKISDGIKLSYEDFMMFMKKLNDLCVKYISSYEIFLKVIYLYMGSVVEVEKMYKYIVFNCLIGNGDVYFKNFVL